jgi:hypothetical protein
MTLSELLASILRSDAIVENPEPRDAFARQSHACARMANHRMTYWTVASIRVNHQHAPPGSYTPTSVQRAR